jgi:hypothetical protein
VEIDVEYFLRNNDILSPSQKASIGTALDEEVAQQAKLDEAISSVSQLLDNLTSMRAQSAKKIERYRGVLHPIRRMPVDMLGEIFLTFIDEHPIVPDHIFGYDPIVVPPALQMPWTLSKVSALWRETVLNLPKLWSQFIIILTAKDVNNRGRSGPSNLVKLQLQRSGTHPLSVVISSTVIFWTPPPHLQGVLFQCHRWKRLYIDLIDPCFDIFGDVYDHLHLLEYLTFTVRIQNSSDAQKCLPSLSKFESAPRLHWLTTWPYILKYLDSFSDRITTYRTPFITPSNDLIPVAEILSSILPLTNLQECTINCTPINGPTAPVETILNRLTKLRVCETEVGGIEQFLTHFHAPSLDLLAVKGEINPASIVAFLEKCQCRLTGLTLIFSGTPTNVDEGLLNILRLLQATLVDLTLDCPLSSETLGTFSDVDGFPQLKSLILNENAVFPQQALDDLRQQRPGLQVALVDPSTLKF